LSVRARGSARSETGIRIVSDWLVKARGVGVGDGDGEIEPDGEGELVGVTLGEGVGSALLVADSDGVGVAEAKRLEVAAAVCAGSGVPPVSSSARVGPTFAKKSAITIRSKRRRARVLNLRGLSSK